MLLTNFPVLESGRTTLVTRCGLSGPAPNETPAAKPAIISLKQNCRKMFPLILSPESARRARRPETQGVYETLMLSFPCDCSGLTCSGYVLAGGRSSRMGRDKARLPFRGGDLAGAVAARSGAARPAASPSWDTPTCRELPIATPAKARWAESSPRLHHTSTDWNLIVACDMPEISAGFLAGLAGRRRAIAGRRRAALRRRRTARTAVRGLSPARAGRSWKQLSRAASAR